MNNTQCLTEVRQSESRTNLVASMPVQEGQKLSMKNVTMQCLKDCTWEDLKGLSLTEGEW